MTSLIGRIALVFALLCAGAAQAQDLIFDCKFKNQNRGGWLPERGVYAVYSKEGSMAVLDPFIYHTNNKKPLTVALERGKPGFYVARWSVDLPTKRNQEVTVSYRIRLSEADSRATIRAWVGSADNEPRGGGRCTVKRPKK